MDKKKNDRGATVNRLTVTEAAERLGCSKATVRNGVKRGLLEGIRGGVCGRLYWVSERSLDRLAKSITGGARS